MRRKREALEKQLEESFAKLSTAMANMDKASSEIEQQVSEYRKQVDTIDKIAPVAALDETKPQPAPQQPKVRSKKTLTDSVLDTISRLLEK